MSNRSIAQFLSPALLAIAGLICTGLAWAQAESYRARLSPMPTTPQTVDSITGDGEVFLTLEGNILSVTGSFAGMSSVATAAHLHHGPPARPGPAVHQLDVTTATGGEIGGEIELTEEQIEALRANSLYVQIHSEGNPPGELRGWIFPREE